MTTTRQHTSPFIIDGQAARRLVRLPLDQPPFPEAKLQELLFAYPELLPIDELEPAFSPMICLGREIPTPAGPIDLLYASPDGYLTLAETKLWSSVEARRTVVAQVLDYAKELSRWNFEQLDQAVRKGLRPDKVTGGGILDIIRAAGVEGFNERTFTDDITRHLRACRLLLLVVGEGIREGMEAMAAHLQSSAALRFSLALVEIALHRIDPQQQWPLYVQPRIVARTTEVIRAVIDIRNASDAVVTVSMPQSEDGPRRGRVRITEEAFFEKLKEKTDSEVPRLVGDLLNALEALDLRPEWGSNSVSLRLDDPVGSDRQYTALVLTSDGSFYLGWLDRPARDGYNPAIAQEYLKGVCQLLGSKMDRKATGTLPQDIASLLAVRGEMLNLVERFVSRLQADAESRRE